MENREYMDSSIGADRLSGTDNNDSADMHDNAGINPQYNIIRERRAVISISPETRERLKDLGRKGDTYDDIINKLIDAYTS